MSIGNKSTRDKRLNNGPYAITDSQNATQRNKRLSLFNSVKAHILIRIKDIIVKTVISGQPHLQHEYRTAQPHNV